MREEITTVDVLLPKADPDLEEEIGYALWELDIAGFELHDAETFSLLVDEPYPLPAGATRWRVNLEGAISPEEAEAQFREGLEDYPDLEIHAWIRDVTGYRTAWMEHFKPTQVSPRVLIHPPWDPGDMSVPVRINIDPGMAFGTGTHETTRLCLELIDDWSQQHQPTTILDVGMGSGILSIAAAKLTDATIYGMDIDADSTREAIRNAEVNGVGDRCHFETGELHAQHPHAELVIANILPHILIAISSQLIEHVQPGGTLMLSGILTSEEARVREHFDRAPLAYGRTVIQNEWCAMVFQKTA